MAGVAAAEDRRDSFSGDSCFFGPRRDSGLAPPTRKNPPLLTRRTLDTATRRTSASSSPTCSRLIAHPNIGRLIRPRRSLSQIFKIAECMPGERLFDNLHNVSDRPMLLKCAIDICTGITHLHPKVLKVSGQSEFQNGVMTAETETYRWMASEAMKHQLYDKKAYAHTFGCCLYLHFYLASGSSVLLLLGTYYGEEVAVEFQWFKLNLLLSAAVEISVSWLCYEYISRRSLFDFLPKFSDFPIVMYFGVDMCQNQNDVMADDTGAYRWMVTEIKNSQPYDNV
ncbi:hypothetical protein ACQ4PT_058308 [Festuca glaucescens]